MHTLITGWSFVDHRNGDGLDNRRQNLRPANDSKNQMNARMRSDNPSGFKGVCADRHRWMARIQLDGRRTYLGYFATPQEAARAYDAAAVELFGEYARPNFPQEMSVRWSAWWDIPWPLLALCVGPDRGRRRRLFLRFPRRETRLGRPLPLTG